MLRGPFPSGLGQSLEVPLPLRVPLLSASSLRGVPTLNPHFLGCSDLPLLGPSLPLGAWPCWLLFPWAVAGLDMKIVTAGGPGAQVGSPPPSTSAPLHVSLRSPLPAAGFLRLGLVYSLAGWSPSASTLAAWTRAFPVSSSSQAPSPRGPELLPANQRRGVDFQAPRELIQMTHCGQSSGENGGVLGDMGRLRALSAPNGDALG